MFSEMILMMRMVPSCANFREPPKAEVRRTLLPCTRVNRLSWKPRARYRGICQGRGTNDGGYRRVDQTDHPGLGAATRRVRFEDSFPWDISAAMAEAPLCYLPLGTLEWHGEHAAVGLDALKAHAVCVLAAKRSGGLVAPPIYWSTDWREDLQDGGYRTGGAGRGGGGQ